MNVFIPTNSLILNTTEFFTAKPDRKKRVLIPAYIRRSLGIKYRQEILIGFKIKYKQVFITRSVDTKGRIYLSSSISDKDNIFSVKTQVLGRNS
ncbi:MAG: hypothetical protein K0B07_03160 [DPANN group archaeon]|nr:hypothetical protein [DPANN group archaeon]